MALSEASLVEDDKAAVPEAVGGCRRMVQENTRNTSLAPIGGQVIQGATRRFCRRA